MARPLHNVKCRTILSNIFFLFSPTFSVFNALCWVSVPETRSVVLGEVLSRLGVVDVRLDIGTTVHKRRDGGPWVLIGWGWVGV
jgi:hypothetical protein